MNKYKLTYGQKKIFKQNLKKSITFIVLLVFGFSFIFPLFQAFFLSFFSSSDISNPYIMYIPSNPTLQNYKDLFTNYDFISKLLFTIAYAGGSALLQTLSCAIVGYGLARFEFRGKKVIMGLIVAFFLVPQTVVMIQNYVLIGSMHINDTLLAFYIPGILGQGINSSIFILIFYNFFSRIPKDLYESAQLEGAKPWVIFSKIVLPLVQGAIIITFVLSFVWYWNDGTIAPQYYRNIPTISQSINVQTSSVIGQSSEQFQQFPIYDGIKAAAITSMVAPLILFYLLIQRKFKESTVGSGLTGQ